MGEWRTAFCKGNKIMAGKKIRMPLDRFLIRVLVLALFAILALLDATLAASHTIPKAWDEAALSSLHVPPAPPGMLPLHLDSESYYRMPVRPMFRTYAVYAPGREPTRYWEWLMQQEPEIAFDSSKINTKAEWIRAGEIVFDAPIVIGATFGVGIQELRDPLLWRDMGVPVASDGTAPFFRYVVREKGKVELGQFSCASCHTRVLPDGTVVKGAQGNYPAPRVNAYIARKRFVQTGNETVVLNGLRSFILALTAVPWLDPDPSWQIERMSLEEILKCQEAIPTGVIRRGGTSFSFPPKIPDLIGLKDWRYFDNTGYVRHRSIGDVMRYAALVQGAECFDRYGTWSPCADLTERARYSDEQLYALTLYLYSLKPPPNPNRFDAEASRGRAIFERQGCGGCHTPPLYTNNKLIPVDGFQSPISHLMEFDILPVSIGTDPTEALRSRKSTGYYKVPSLKGLWYRGPFEHSGAVASLEDWFHPRRLQGVVRGHRFGLELSQGERKALIQFLKTL
jgi:hypothetical protein